MHDVLQLLVILAGVGVLVATLLERLRLPVVAGLVLAGGLAGPHAFGLVTDVHVVEMLAEIGVVLLLFTIGLEFSFSRIQRMGRLLLVGGALQVGVTVAAVAAGALAFGWTGGQSVFLGFFVALSSTAIVLRALDERDEIDSPHGRAVVGVLLFQDLCVVPMVLLLPVLAGQTGDVHPALAVAAALVKAAVAVVVTVLVARLVVPKLLGEVDRAKSRESFLLAIVATCAATAWATSHAGLSVALGAFLAGMVLADSDYAHRALAEVLPLRGLFTSIFFLSVGMLFDLRTLLIHPVAVPLLILGIFVLKGLIAGGAVLALRMPMRVAVLAGAGLAQVGEFGFVLAAGAREFGLLEPEKERIVIAAAVVSMAATPVILRLSPHLATQVSRLRALDRLTRARGEAPAAADPKLHGHLIIAGYGVAGRAACQALADSGLPHLVLELSHANVQRAREDGHDALYGDVTTEEALLHAGIERASALLLVVDDASAIELAVPAARRIAPQVRIHARTRYLGTVPRLLELGADQVVASEVEAGLEIIARVLRDMDLPRNVIDDRIRDARDRTQASARGLKLPRKRLGELGELDEMKIETFLVREGAHAAGRSLVDLQLRTVTGALAVASRRDGTISEQPEPDDPFRAGDVIYLVGDGPHLTAARRLLEDGEATA